MGKDTEIERFGAVLAALAKQRDEELDRPVTEFTPLGPALQERLLRIQTVQAVQAAGAARQVAWSGRLALRLRALLAQRWLPYVLVPTAAALLIVPMMAYRAGRQSAARSHVAKRALQVGVNEATLSPEGQAILGGGAGEVQQQSELRVKRRATLSLMLPPAPGDEGPLAVRAFLRRDGVLRNWKVNLEQQPDGSFVLHWPVRLLPDLAADQELLFAYGRPTALPTLEELSSPKPAADPRWHLVSLHLLVED